MMPTKGLVEVILYVEDMAGMVAFYRDVLGLAVKHPTGVTNYGQEHWVTFETGGCTLALHSGGRARASGEGSEIVFLVDDILAAREELVARGAAMGEVVMAAPGLAVCGGRDPEGNRFAVEARS